MADAAKGFTPESVLKRRKHREDLRKEALGKRVVEKAAAKIRRKTIHDNAAKYLKEYAATEKASVDARRAARASGDFYVDPEAKLAVVVRIRGVNGVEPKTRKILQLLRLRQIHNATFVRLNFATLQMLQLIKPYIAWGYPNLKTVRELIYKRGHAKLNKQRIAITDNSIVESALKEQKIVCVEDLVHEIFTVGEHFKEANNFLWPFKLSSPLGGLERKLTHFIEGGQCGNREHKINALVQRML